MIGFFDSGFGGLSILKEVEKRLPDYSYIYLGDNARTPYGSLSQNTIYEFVEQGMSKLFEMGAELVLLACNTASSSALRRIQQKFLPQHYPNKRVLGVIVPTAEEIVSITKTKHVGVIGTSATIESFAFPREITKLDNKISVHQVPAPLLVPIIEEGGLEWSGLENIIEKYVHNLLSKSNKIDSVIMGCTHYALIEYKFRKFIPNEIKIISQGKIVAEKLENYLYRHKDMDKKLGREKKRIFLTTEDSAKVRQLFELFYGNKVDICKTTLNKNK